MLPYFFLDRGDSMKKMALFFLSLSLVFVSCTTYPSGNIGVITAFMETGNTKYYIRPALMTADREESLASVKIDFTYQKVNADYVSDAYVNFTLHDKTTAFIKEACFILPEHEKPIPLVDIKTLDRNTSAEFIRVTTRLEKDFINPVLEVLHVKQGRLRVLLTDENQQDFIPTDELVLKITEAFSK